MEDRLSRISRLNRILTQAISIGGVGGLIALAVLVMADVALRFLFASPIDGAQEIGKLLVTVVVASFFPVALAERRHIVVDLLSRCLGVAARSLFDAFGALVTFVFFVFVGWRFILYTDELHRAGETTWILGWAVTPWWAVTTVFILICAPVQAIVLGASLRAARHRRDAREPED